jgi:hypothetical protein
LRFTTGAALYINTFFLGGAASVSQAVRNTSRGAFFRIFIK